MDRLWTPWRREFVGAGGSSDCFVGEKAGEGGDADDVIVHGVRQAFVLLNLYPYNSGHLMVAPFDHSGDLGALSAETSTEVWRLTERAVAALSAEYRPEGFNVGMNLGRVAGAGGTDHLHVHVVARWNGDTNFMPVTAETKVLPESLDQTYRRLLPHFQSGHASDST